MFGRLKKMATETVAAVNAGFTPDEGAQAAAASDSAARLAAAAAKQAKVVQETADVVAGPNSEPEKQSGEAPASVASSARADRADRLARLGSDTDETVNGPSSWLGGLTSNLTSNMVTSNLSKVSQSVKNFDVSKEPENFKLQKEIAAA